MSNLYPIVVQEVILNKNDFPQPGEMFKFRNQLHRVIAAKIHVKIKKMYFTNIWLEGEGTPA